MMGRVQWVDEGKTVIRVETGLVWDLDDLTTDLLKAFTMVEQTVGQITVILVLESHNTLPNGFVLHFKKLIKDAPLNLHKVIVVSDDTEVESALIIFRRLYGYMRYMVSLVPTCQHAEALIYADGSFWLTPAPSEAEVSEKSEEIAS